MIVPYDRYTQYMTQEQAQYCLDTPIDEGGFNEMYGVVEKTWWENEKEFGVWSEFATEGIK